jgi:Methyltransferase domain
VTGRFKLQLSRGNPNTRNRWEVDFGKGALWEQNQGPDQTRRFAEGFHRHCQIPWQEFSMLDVGCALGDALPVWHEKYPCARLAGCDVAESAVQRCRERHGDIAEFFRASFEEIEGFWDIIYCSNVLEHFEQHREIAERLLGQCKVLMVLTPFGEMRRGSPLQPGRDDYLHVATFYRDTFDNLVASGKASRVEATIFSCPEARWGLTHWQRFRWLLGSARGKRYMVQEPLQILYAIHNLTCPEYVFVQDEGLYPGLDSG